MVDYSQEKNLKTNIKFDETPEFVESLKIRDTVKDEVFLRIHIKTGIFKSTENIVEEKLKHYNDKLNPIYKNLMTISTF